MATNSRMNLSAFYMAGLYIAWNRREIKWMSRLWETCLVNPKLLCSLFFTFTHIMNLSVHADTRLARLVAPWCAGGGLGKGRELGEGGSAWGHMAETHTFT